MPVVIKPITSYQPRYPVVDDFLGIDRIVYGSDYPWADPGAQLRFWEETLPDEVWRRISHENAARNLSEIFPVSPR